MILFLRCFYDQKKSHHIIPVQYVEIQKSTKGIIPIAYLLETTIKFFVFLSGSFPM